jgi:inward rectifier potassium channel
MTQMPTINIVGARRPQHMRDVHHAFLRTTWPRAIVAIVVAYLSLNALFGMAYAMVGGIANARPGSIVDGFSFSIQTMGTIGYGFMYPTAPLTNLVVTIESVTSLVVTALATGLLFSKFSILRPRLAYSRQAVIGPMDGIPTLMVRIGNERGNQIREAQIRMEIYRTERTREGKTFYRLLDLAMTRNRAPALSSAWNAMHPITADSPLYGLTPESFKTSEIELLVSVAGIDDTSMQPVLSTKRYEDHEIVWGAEHVDVIKIEDDGSITFHLDRFHDIRPTEPIPEFPYSATPTFEKIRDHG